MVSIAEILLECEALLSPTQFTDYCPNGLQVAGKPNAIKMVTGVSSCQALFDAAVEVKADLILVHHGLFWKGDNPCVVGVLRDRLATLLNHQINLIAYHLPLDVHSVYGNNILFGQRLDIQNIQQFPVKDGMLLGNVGYLSNTMTGEEFGNFITEKIGRIPLHIPGHGRRISTVAWCTGAAQDFLTDAFLRQADAYISGEISERTTHLARELQIDYFACGHHASERYGVQALGDYLADKFTLEHQFIDIDNPV